MNSEDYFSESEPDYYDDTGLAYDVGEVPDYEDEHGVIDDSSPLSGDETVYEIFENCIEPSLTAAWTHVFPPMVYCLLFTVIVKAVSPPERIFHALSCIFGFLCLLHLSGPPALVTLALCFCSYIIGSRVHCLGTRVSFWAVLRVYLAYMVIREYVDLSSFLAENWDQVRGIHMLYLLRALSLQYEYSTGKRTQPLSFLEYNGYMLCPGTILFGPWISFGTYVKLRAGIELRVWWLIKTVCAGLISMLCLVMSSCGVYWLFSGVDSKWLIATRDAMSIRFSHYFISYASETMCLLCGFYSSTDSELTQFVTSPLSIEFPRSLVSVVVHWNRPMHTWLKLYVFRPLQKFGPLKAVLYTFLISSALHGLHFPVTMVLLSLGIFAYVEHTTREKLASVFDACIRSKACTPDCGHANKSTAPAVIATCLCFSFLACFHLVYVGIMMDVRETDAEGEPATKWAMISTQIGRWQQLGFASHWTALVMYGIMALI